MQLCALGQNPSVHDPLQGSILAGFGSLRSRPLLKVIVDKWVFLPMLGMFMPRDSDGARSVRYQWEGISHVFVDEVVVCV